jgi:hypothetical protein
MSDNLFQFFWKNSSRPLSSFSLISFSFLIHFELFNTYYWVCQLRFYKTFFCIPRQRCNDQNRKLKILGRASMYTCFESWFKKQFVKIFPWVNCFKKFKYTFNNSYHNGWKWMMLNSTLMLWKKNCNWITFMNDKSNDGCNSSICDKLNSWTIWNISYVDFKVFSTWFIIYVGVVRCHHWSQWEFSLSLTDEFHIVSIIANLNVIAWMKMKDNCILCNLLL